MKAITPRLAPAEAHMVELHIETRSGKVIVTNLDRNTWWVSTEELWTGRNLSLLVGKRTHDLLPIVAALAGG